MKKLSRGLARRMKEAFEAVGPFIEKHTLLVCPSCRNVCCIDRHGTHEDEDIAFIHGLGEEPPAEPPRVNDTEPCRHLSTAGCTIPRWQRPYRCTWYFCQPLLENMPLENPREYRDFVEALERLRKLRESAAEEQ